jgi:hypothetical protein
MYLTVTHTPTSQSGSSVNRDHVHAGFQAASSEAGLSAIKSLYFKAQQPPITHFWLVTLYYILVSGLASPYELQRFAHFTHHRVIQTKPKLSQRHQRFPV